MSQEIGTNEQIQRPPNFGGELWRMVGNYLFSEEKLSAWFFLLASIAFTILYTYLVPLAPKALGDVITALSNKDTNAFWLALPLAIIYPLISVAVVSLAQVFNSMLSLNWRQWLTRNFLSRYFTNRAFYHLSYHPEIKNPDQRIQVETDNFTKQFRGTLTSLLLVPGTIISGSIALWQLSPTLVLLLVGYGIVVLIVAYLIFAKRLSRLFYMFQKLEATFRTSLVRVRENAEAIAFYRGEDREESFTKQRFQDVYETRNKIIRWNTVYFEGFQQIIVTKLPIILPFLIFVPFIVSKEMPAGTLTQAIALSGIVAGAWTQLSGLIDDFARLYSSSIRLIVLRNALDAAGEEPDASKLINTIEKTPLEVSDLTLQTPDYNRTLFQKLNFQLPDGEGLLVVGESGVGKSSLLRSIAGLWCSGSGQIIRPPLSEMLFLSQKPYMTLGTLRSQLLYPSSERDISEKDLQSALQKVNLSELPEKVGGFEAEIDWGSYLSPGQQQRLAFARVIIARPKFVVLDESTSALDVNNEARLYEELQQKGTTFISVGHRPSVVEYHQKVLKFTPAAEWKLYYRDEYIASEQNSEGEADET